MNKKICVILLIILFLFSMVPSFADLASVNYYWSHPGKINVYIPSDKRRTVMKEAFHRWELASARKIDFNIIDFPKHADIVVEFVEKINTQSQYENSIVAGLTTTSYTQSGIKQAKIQIASKNQSNLILSENHIRSVMIHEIGHALGLREHSNNKASVMYYCVLDGQNILTEDVNRIKKLYRIN